MADLPTEQFRAAAGDFEFDKDPYADPLQNAAVHGGENTVVGQRGQADKQLVEKSENGYGNQTAGHKFPSELFKAEQQNGNVNNNGHQPDADAVVGQDIEKGCQA